MSRGPGLTLPLACSSSGGGDGGGGGGGTSGNTPIAALPALALTTDNAGTVSQKSLESSDGLGVVGDAIDASSGIFAAGEEQAGLAGVIWSVFNQYVAPSHSPYKGPAFTDNCSNVGGTVTVTQTGFSDNQLDEGDEASIAFDNCSDDFGVTLNGTMTLTVSELTGDPENTAQDFSVGLTVELTAFTVNGPEGDVAVSGILTFGFASDVSENSLTLTVGGSDLSVTSDSQSFGLSGEFSYSFTIGNSGFSASYSATINIDSLGGSVTVETLMPLTANAGVIVITGNGSTITLTFSGGGAVNVAVDENDDGTPECSQDLTIDTLDLFDPMNC